MIMICFQSRNIVLKQKSRRKRNPKDCFSLVSMTYEQWFLFVTFGTILTKHKK